MGIDEEIEHGPGEADAVVHGQPYQRCGSTACEGIFTHEGTGDALEYLCGCDLTEHGTPGDDGVGDVKGAGHQPCKDDGHDGRLQRFVFSCRNRDCIGHDFSNKHWC